MSATLVDDVDESKFIPVTYKNIPGGVVSKRGFILKESFDDYVEKCKQGTCSDNDKFFKVYFTPSIYTLPQVLNIKDFDVDDEYLYSELYKSFEKYEDGEEEQESECGNCNNCKCGSCDCCDDEEESEHDDNDVVKGPSFVEYLADKMSRGTPRLRNVNDLADAMFDYLFKFKNGDF